MRIRKMGPATRVRYLAAILLALTAEKAWCQDSSSTTDPLLDLFVKKGYVTQQEAQQVEAEAKAAETNNPAYQPPPISKWKITDGIKSVQLYGDIRFRYEGRTASDPVDQDINLERERYALRFGLRGDAFDNFYYGFRLETSANPRSPWVTLGQSSTSSPYQGPFGKSSDSLAIGQVYMGWRPTDWLDVTLGKMPNMLYTTPMVWDNDLNPEGAFEQLKYTVGQADFFGNFAQYLYADFNPYNAPAGFGINTVGSSLGLGQHTENIFMLVEQAGFTYHITPTMSAKIAAGIYNYEGLHQSSGGGDASTAPYFGDTYIGEGAHYYYNAEYPSYPEGASGYSPGTYFAQFAGLSSQSYPFNQVGLNDLLVLEVPFEFNFKIDHVAGHAFGDVAYNFDGAQRAEAAAAGYAKLLSYYSSIIPPQATANSFPAQTHDVKAYQLGIGFGSDDIVYGPNQGLVYGTEAHKHDWEIRTYWQHIEQYSLDPNLIDSDFFEGAENLEGIYAAGAYAFTGNVILTVRYGFAHRINNVLGTGGSDEDIPQMNPIEHYYLIQADATFLF